MSAVTAYSVGPAPPAGARRLHLNEFRYEHAPGVVAALREAARQAPDVLLAHYQAGPSEALVADIARYVGAQSPANILLTPGSDDALRAAIDTSYARGHECVVMGAPGYTHFEHYARLKPLRVIQYAIGLGTSPADHAASLRYYADELGSGCLVYLCSPNNPTGDLWAPNTVAGFAAAYPRSLFLVDEAYIEFASEPPPGSKREYDAEGDAVLGADVTEADAARQLNAQSCAQIALTFDNVVVTRTFSKAFGLAAMRLGYAVGRPQTIRALGVAVSPKAFNPIAFDIARAVLREPGHYLNAAIAARGGMRRTVMRLRALGWWAADTPANFYLVFVGGGAAQLTAALQHEGVFVRNRDELPGMAGFVRITAGTPADNQAVVAAFGRQQPPADPVPPQSLYTGKGHIAAVKVLMRRTLSTLADAGVTVWAQGGTMLGIRRHGGMIPSDDDGDLAYVREPGAGDPVALTQPRFLAAGLTLQRNRTDAYWQIGTNDLGEPISAVHIDLFSYRLHSVPGVDLRFILDDERFAAEDPASPQAHCNTQYAPDELFPLTPGAFYNMDIMMPAQADRVLRRALGADYMTVMRMRVAGQAPRVVELTDWSPA
jgi:histidinol-phosphate aminotransferase